jgi:hypothetical protein
MNPEGGTREDRENRPNYPPETGANDPRGEPAMARIPPVDPADTSGYTASVLTAQTKTWGAPLNNHLIYAHRPKLFKAVRGMWTGVDADGLIGPDLLALVNRRVATLNGCVF